VQLLLLLLLWVRSSPSHRRGCGVAQQSHCDGCDVRKRGRLLACCVLRL
jgi:hypothetical protein